MVVQVCDSVLIANSNIKVESFIQDESACKLLNGQPPEVRQ